MNPAELLDDRIADLALKRTKIPVARQQAWLDAGWLAIKTVILAGQNGNVSCREASKEILRLLQ